jgi:anti-sigma regulatory factor (Ser/Thr protein kinase)
MTGTFSVDIPRDLAAPAKARRAVEELAPAIDPAVLADVKLLVSELVTNSVKYGASGAVRLCVEARSPRAVHVEVLDRGAGFVPMARNRPAADPGGWGLHLVHALSDRWGVQDDAARVWFDIARGPAADGASAAVLS